MPRADRTSAPRRAIASAITTSVASGRCGPCASSAPTGRIATSRPGSSSLSSSHVEAAHCRTFAPSDIMAATMGFEPPAHLNIADWLLDARVREGRGDRIALRTDRRDWTYAEVQELSNRFGNLLLEAGVEPEQRVIIALPDGPEFVAGLFGALKIGAVVVMVNPAQPRDAIDYFLDYTRAAVAIVARDATGPFPEA